MNLSRASAKFRVPLRRHRSSDRQPDRPQVEENVSTPAPGLSVGQTASSSNTPLDSGQPSSDAPKRNLESLRHTVWHGIRNVLGIVYDSADILPPLKSALGGVAAILRTLDQYSGNKEKAAAIIKRINSFDLTKFEKKENASEQERRDKLQNKLVDILKQLKSIRDQNAADRVANSASDEQKIAGLIQDIHEALSDYQLSLQQDLYTMACESIKTADLLLLDKLPRAKDAGYLSGNRQKCLRGTRTKILQDFVDWASDPRNRRVCWLDGVAGTGKTTLAQSFAEWCFMEKLLGASFYCSRNIEERRNIHLIFPTLSFQLAYRLPEFRAVLLSTIRSGLDVGHISLDEQVKTLLVKPLKTLKLSKPIVIVLDALDECEEDQSTSLILGLLAPHIESLPFIKFFITSRPEPRIRSGFRHPLLKPHTEIFLLHEVDRESVDKDIETYFKARFSELALHRSDFDVSTPWPELEELVVIIAKASGLFIYAFTTVEFVAAHNHNPRERLSLITSMPHDTSLEGQSGLDALYTKVFQVGFTQELAAKDATFFQTLRLVVGSVALVFNPLSRIGLAALLGMKEFNVRTKLRSLHSLLIVPDPDDEPIRVYHKSVADYLTDAVRCTRPEFYVEPAAHHGLLAIRCLELMNEKLVHHLCKLPRYIMNRDIENLPAIRKTYIGDALAYACRFWTGHIRSSVLSEHETSVIVGLLTIFIREKFLQWLEVISLLGDMRGAVHALQYMEDWLLGAYDHDAHPDPLSSFYDARNFLITFFDVIQESASHIYHSALPWAPRYSLVSMRHLDQLAKEVQVYLGFEIAWGLCPRTIRTGSVVYSIAFSNYGKFIATCGDDPDRHGFVQIFEVTTGVCLATLDGHDRVATSIAFSPDDSVLVSVSDDKKIKIWDVQTGLLRKTIEGHTERVNCVAFSPHGGRIVTGGKDRTIRIWKISSGRCMHIFEGHSTAVTSVCWSLSGNYVISGCDDGTIMSWDILARVCSMRISIDSRASEINFFVKQDASKIAYTSGPSIIVHEAGSEAVKTIARGHGYRSTHFSRDGGRIVFVVGPSVFVWDLERGIPISKFESQGARVVTSVAFSPSGKSVAAGCAVISGGGFVNIWRSNSRYLYPPEAEAVHEHKFVWSVCFSPDGKMVAWGEEKIVKILDVAEDLVRNSFSGHSGEVTSVAFCPESSLLASASTDNTVRLWNVATGECLTVARIGFSPGLDLKVSFEEYGTEIVARSPRNATRWRISSSPTIDSNYASSSTSSHPQDVTLVPSTRPARPESSQGDSAAQQFKYPMNSDWILDALGRRICWLPPARRGRCMDFWRKLVVVGAEDGGLGILDFSKAMI